MPDEITFPSTGATCAGWRFQAVSDAFESSAGRPCVVMAHGFSGTRDTGLRGYADGFAAAGLNVLLFDYRGFGASGGTPRQVVSYRRQREDYRAAVRAARHLDGVDPARIVLWGTSYSGGHVLDVAATDPAVAAVVAMTPFVDGAATLAHLARANGVVPLLRLTATGLADVVATAARRPSRLVPAVGEVGSGAVMSKPGALAAMQQVAGPTWRNEVSARVALEVAVNRPISSAGRVRAPLLVQAGDHDTVVPVAAAVRAAARAGDLARLLRYPLDHFDVYDGPWQEKLLADQLGFLTEHLAGTSGHAAS